MDREHIALLAFLALAVLGGAYLTALLCRGARNRVGWHRALIGAIASGLVCAVFVWFGLLLPHGDIGKGATVWGLVLWAFMWACGFAFVPAVLAVWYYRRRSRNVDDVA